MQGVWVDPYGTTERPSLLLANRVSVRVRRRNGDVVGVIGSAPQEGDLTIGSPVQVPLHGSRDASGLVHAVHRKDGREDAKML